jgi:hypothetical protein
MYEARRKPVRAECQGVPVYGYGYTYVYGICPDFLPGLALQRGNSAPLTKIRPKKSWEIESNMIGVSPPRMPRSDLNDFQPQLSIRLIDGDPDTFWCSRPQGRPNVEPAWIRIDLACEQTLTSVVLVPREDGKGLPGHITIKLSRDACNWTTMHDVSGVSASDGTPLTYAFAPTRAKQVWITGQDLTSVFYGYFSFALAEVQVLDAAGENVALVSRGGSATVSSTHYGIPSQKELHDMLWPTFYDLGVKWARVGYWGDVLNWHFVEQVKGQYEIDPAADAAITQSVENGVNVVLGLGHTNWLYTPEGHRDPKQAKQLWLTQEPWYGRGAPNASGTLPSTTIPGMLEGFENYVRFVVRHFRDRVHYWEIWNEENVCWNDGNPALCPTYFAGPKAYCEWFKRAVRIIKEESPEAKIVIGGIATGIYCTTDTEFLQACLDEGIGPLLDVIAWHGPYILPMGSGRSDFAQTKIFEKLVSEIKHIAEAGGFRGEYHINEWGVSAPYPLPEGSFSAGSELCKAKYASRLLCLYHQLGITSCWCEPWNEQESAWDISLFRPNWAADPVSPLQPQMAYYVFRNLCTLLESVTPTQDVKVEFSVQTRRITTATLKQKGGDTLVAVWVLEQCADAFADVVTDIAFPGMACERAVGYDVLNGTEQELVLTQVDGVPWLRGMLVRDWPTIIRLSA